jgi:hypothetical protein
MRDYLTFLRPVLAPTSKNIEVATESHDLLRELKLT